MEKFTQIFLKEDDQRILPGKSFSFDFAYTPEQHKEHRIFFTGEVDNFYFWKSEYSCVVTYKHIDESLVPGTIGPWGLKFVGAEHPLIAARKQNWPPVLGYLGLKGHTDQWKYGISAKATDLHLRDGGYLRLRVEIRHKKEGVFIKHTKYPPDEIITIDIPEGTYDMTEFSGMISLPDDKIANLMYIVEGEKFDGQVIFEAPFLTSSNGYNVMPPFSTDSAQYPHLYNWFGVNLSKAEWPAMRITLNGQVVFDDEFFERCHRYSEKEITLPENVLIPGTNHVEFTLTNDWHNAVPYRLHEVGIVSEDKHSFDIVACPEIVTAGKIFGLLLDLRNPTTLTIDTEAEVVSSLHFPEAGLQVLQLKCDTLRHDLTVTLSDGITTQTATVRRVIERAEDHNVTGTGDLIYVDQATENSLNYFKWYKSNHIGDLLTIRPTYRWSGFRVRNDAMWRKLITLMNALGMKYSHMLDCREPPGYCGNPSVAELSVDTGNPSGFLGRQVHERDGAYCYWGDHANPGDFWNNNKCYDAEMFFDICNRYRHDDPDHAGSEFYHEDWFDDGKRFWLCHDPHLPADMEVQAKAVMNSLRIIRKGSTRHTGPSILFKYFCQSGYDWIGAETMDSPTEFLLAALRGAAEAYHVPTVGVHHALQWSTSPHDTEYRYRRYRLALYVSWMQGSHEHNTEEGLWHMEEYYEAHHRHGIAAKSHLKMQQDFNRYIHSHSRQGRLRANVGILHGRYDGFPCFGGGSIWGRTHRQGFNKDFDAEQSWNIPRNSFYPHGTRFHATGHKCRTDGPIGLVSPNARGCFNIVPVEEDWADYPFLAAFGYNKAESADLDRLLKKVENGATVLLTLGHLTCTTDRAAIERYDLAFEDHPIFEAMGFAGTPVCETGVYNGASLPLGKNLTVSDDEILVRADDGTPLVVEKKCGNGSILFFNTLYYPANAAIKDLYIHYFESRSDAVCDAEAVFPEVGSDVQAVIYDQPDGSQAVYFIAVDWWNDPEAIRTAQLRINGIRYEVTLPFGVMKKALVKGDTAVLCQSESADVLRFTDTGFVAQGEGTEEFLIFQNGNTTAVTVSFDNEVQKEIKL